MIKIKLSHPEIEDLEEINRLRANDARDYQAKREKTQALVDAWWNRAHDLYEIPKDIDLMIGEINGQRAIIQVAELEDSKLNAIRLFEKGGAVPHGNYH